MGGAGFVLLRFAAPQSSAIARSTIAMRVAEWPRKKGRQEIFPTSTRPHLGSAKMVNRLYNNCRLSVYHFRT